MCVAFFDPALIAGDVNEDGSISVYLDLVLHVVERDVQRAG